MKIAVLALQGAFIEHINMLNKLGVKTVEIRKKSDFSGEFDGLILPGGESSVVGKLLRDLDLFEDIKKAIDNGLPVFGTCAGLILLAKNIENQSTNHLATLDITVKRNAFGRQYDSFCVKDNFNGDDIEMIFIRAPYICSAMANVNVLSKYGKKIMAVRQGNQLGVAFHPELTGDCTVHKYFLDMIKQQKQNCNVGDLKFNIVFG